jgi:hypothetical protein
VCHLQVGLGASFFICNKTFAIGKSIVELVLHEFIVVVNVDFKRLICWPVRTKMQVVMGDFKHFCGLPNIQGAIDDTHIRIFKPLILYLEDFFTIREMDIQLLHKLM